MSRYKKLLNLMRINPKYVADKIIMGWCPTMIGLDGHCDDSWPSIDDICSKLPTDKGCEDLCWFGEGKFKLRDGYLYELLKDYYIRYPQDKDELFCGRNYYINQGKVWAEPIGTASSMHTCWKNCARYKDCDDKKEQPIWICEEEEEQ